MLEELYIHNFADQFKDQHVALVKAVQEGFSLEVFQNFLYDCFRITIEFVFALLIVFLHLSYHGYQYVETVEFALNGFGSSALIEEYQDFLDYSNEVLVVEEDV